MGGMREPQRFHPDTKASSPSPMGGTAANTRMAINSQARRAIAVWKRGELAGDPVFFEGAERREARIRHLSPCEAPNFRPISEAWRTPMRLHWLGMRSTRVKAGPCKTGEEGVSCVGGGTLCRKVRARWVE